jgi:two-component system, NtrC family, nitrogen regulation sensor histidine kinase NtrY
VSLRHRILLLVAGTVTVAVASVTWFVIARARDAFEAVDAQRSAALVAQLRREFAWEGDELGRRLDRVVAADEVRTIALDLGAPSQDVTTHLSAAAALATAHGLDFLDLVADDGTIVSSAHWPARFGYRRDRLGSGAAAVLNAEETPEARVLGLFAERTLRSGEVTLHAIGGRRVDQQLLSSLGVPAGMRVLLYRNLEPGFVPRDLVGASGTIADGRPFEPLIARVRADGREESDAIRGPDGPESIHGVPLVGRDRTVLGVLIVGTSRREREALTGSIQRTGAAVAGIGVLAGLLLSYLLAARVTRPIERLADGAREVAAGRWDVRIETGSSGEVGALSEAFASMTAQLADQRERLVQAERVAAWRELARRLAHELKNPLFPLRITVDNLQRARRLPPSEFTEVFDESTRTLSAGLENLTGVIGKFSDFAKMPKPEFDRVDINESARAAVSLFDAQRSAPGAPAVTATLDLDPAAGTVRADPDQLRRALQNLVLNALDAMPRGGRLTVRTSRRDGTVCVEVADTGEGLTEEERTRLFTPYYTTKQHGTGLGLAIVQSVISDHHGKILVESEPGRGTTFRLELPVGGDT